MKKIYLALGFILIGLTGCQLVSPIFVDYNGVRRDVATWINQQSLLSMQQKRSLTQLSKAQQKVYSLDLNNREAVLNVAKENQMALHCANLHHVSDKKIQQLQQHIFDASSWAKFQQFEQTAPQIKLDASSIQCE
ncbi:MAG: hypothetical protein ACN6OV_09260 [Acinetobacter sp.]|uniref:hypothetical protein n=1 Tax=Acinetobacter sp. TaxID=472 RepID=UPI003D03DA02